MARRSVPGEQASLEDAETKCCPRCAGDGFLGFRVCATCGGTGKVTILPLRKVVASC